MRITIAIAFTCLARLAAGQVETDVPLRFTGPDGDRQVEGLAPPASTTSLVTLEGAAQGAWLWAVGTVNGTVIDLSTQPAVSAYADGLLLRFITPATLSGAISLNVDGVGAAALLRPDGLVPVRGQLVQGSVCEVLFAGGRFILMNASERGCPPNSLMVNERLCIDQSSTNNQLFYTAVSVCAARGGKLCTWDEYHGACIMLGAQLTGMFNEWEWVDDTANHTQTALQAARTSCYSQRSAGNPLATTGDTRCCYHPR
ncbi:MAG: hypothetical protein H6591_12815 [Flavobacteriales bacterium]|nr:hypothetical protein [Flavobacteriales bacterium]